MSVALDDEQLRVGLGRRVEPLAGNKPSGSHAESAASARTTITRLPKVCSSRRARPWWSSTATTRCPASTSGPVIEPVPAPMSRTSAPSGRAASPTRRRADRSSSWCQPHRGVERATVAKRHEEDDHGCRVQPTVTIDCHRFSGNALFPATPFTWSVKTSAVPNAPIKPPRITPALGADGTRERLL